MLARDSFISDPNFGEKATSNIKETTRLGKNTLFPRAIPFEFPALSQLCVRIFNNEFQARELV